MPSFDPNMPSFDLNMPSFDLDIPSFDLNVPKFDLNMPSFDLNIPSFDPNMPSFDLNTPSFDLNVPTFDLNMSSFCLTSNLPNSQSLNPQVTIICTVLSPSFTLQCQSLHTSDNKMYNSVALFEPSTVPKSIHKLQLYPQFFVSPLTLNSAKIYTQE